jgi:hypothetical protein
MNMDRPVGRRRGRPRGPARLARTLIDRLAAGRLEPAELAREFDRAFPEMARAAGRLPEVLQALDSLARLADARTRVIVSTYRTDAALALLKMATSEPASDLARRACVDLLGFDLDPFRGEGSGGPPPSAPAPIDDAAVRDALDRLGRAES